MRTEDIIEFAILEWLNVQGHFSFKIPDQRECADGVYRKHPWMPRGIPDICCIWKHKTLFFEVKTDKGRLSKYQKIIHGKMNDVYVVRSIAEVEHLLSILDQVHYPKF